MENVDKVSTDVLIIGGGPSGLSAAIHLADLLEKSNITKRILLIEKGAQIGSHILSGAVIKTDVFKELLPEVNLSEIPFDCDVTTDETLYFSEKSFFKLPVHPPYMNNKNNKLVSLGNLCRWLANIAEEKGVEIYPGFAVDEILYKDGKVIGAKTKATGVDHHGKQLENYVQGTEIQADITIFAEGTRGSLAKGLIAKQGLDVGKNPQVYSIGIKELWKIQEGTIEEGAVYHTMGYPLNSDEFGGGFIYGLSDNRVALGLVMGLDFKDPTFDPHAAMQVWKTHPRVSHILRGGNIIEFGAKTLPEGGYYSMPKFYGDNFMIVGDSAGFLSMPSLKGVHLAIKSGMLAAQSASLALKAGNTSESMLAHYESAFKKSWAHKELYATRNFRQSFTKGMLFGAIQFGVQLISGGACLRGKLSIEKDNEVTKTLDGYKKPFFKERFAGKLEFDKVLTFDKVTDVFYSKAKHDEEQITHLVIEDMDAFKRHNMKDYGAPCQHFCAAEVYEMHKDKNGNEELRIHAENCVHCKTCDIKSPHDAISWVPPYGGDGPDYDYM
jgi:electron-transferring-flavoprotein dehydrogenase